MDALQWNAIVQCDSSWDGRFLYGVKTTGVFCRPSCKSRTPRQDNVVIFLAPFEAVVEGYRPCKRCKPDQRDLPNEETAHRVMRYIEEHYHHPLTLRSISKILHVSPCHLQRVFKRVTGLTPAEFTKRTRLEAARQYLTSGSGSITDIAAAVGFSTAAHFTTTFRRFTGITPTEFRSRIARYQLQEESYDAYSDKRVLEPGAV